MELFMEIVMDILFEGTAEIVKSKKFSKVLRYCILGMILGFMGLFFFESYVQRENERLMWTFIALGSVLALFLLLLFYRFAKARIPE
jgi:H+/Cl- antiporter ClcA